jgi:hypothetical protein
MSEILRLIDVREGKRKNKNSSWFTSEEIDQVHAQEVFLGLDPDNEKVYTYAAVPYFEMLDSASKYFVVKDGRRTFHLSDIDILDKQEFKRRNEFIQIHYIKLERIRNRFSEGSENYNSLNKLWDYYRTFKCNKKYDPIAVADMVCALDFRNQPDLYLALQSFLCSMAYQLDNRLGRGEYGNWWCGSRYGHWLSDLDIDDIWAEVRASCERGDTKDIKKKLGDHYGIYTLSNPAAVDKFTTARRLMWEYIEAHEQDN